MCAIGNLLFKEEKAVTRARNQLISLDTTPYYQCISRCVRRAFLWGEDSLTGKNYEHRKEGRKKGLRLF
jgi:hypothetical protein